MYICSISDRNIWFLRELIGSAVLSLWFLRELIGSAVLSLCSSGTMSPDSESSKSEVSNPGDEATAVDTAVTELDAENENERPVTQELPTVDDFSESIKVINCEDTGSLATSKTDKPDELEIREDEQEKHESEMEDTAEQAETADRAWKEFVDGEWNIFWHSVPDAARVAEDEMRTNWLEKNRDRLTKEFASSDQQVSGDGTRPLEITDESLRSDGPYALQTLISITVSANRSALQRDLCSLDKTQVRDFQDFIKQVWLSFWVAVPSEAQISEALVFENWWRKEGMKLVQQFLHDCKSAPKFVFEPEVSPDDLGDADLTVKARQLTARVREVDAAIIRKDIETAYQETVKIVPEYLRPCMGNKLRVDWLRKNYFEIVEQVLSNQEGRFEFKPLVDFGTISPEQKRCEIMKMCERVNESKAKIINDQVELQFEEECGDVLRVHAWDSNVLRDEMRREFLKHNYFDIVLSVITEQRHKETPIRGEQIADDQSSQATLKSSRSKRNANTPADAADNNAKASDSSKVSPASSISSTNMFTSPKRRKTAPESAPSGPDKVVSISQLHKEDLKDCCPIIQAYVLFFEEQPRYTKVTARGRNSDSDNVAVVTLLIADKSGPIQFELWRDVAVSTVANLTEWETTVSENTQICIEIKNFSIKEEHRSHINECRKVVGNENTIVERVDPTYPNMQEACRMDALLFTGDFSLLAATVPFMGNITGVVCDVQSETQTQKGIAMMNFRLQDMHNKSVNCIAYDRHSGNPVLVDGNMVVLYFAQGQAGMRSGQPGALWLYNTAHVVFMKSGCRVLPSEGTVHMRSGSASS